MSNQTSHAGSNHSPRAEPVLEVRDLTKRFGGITAVEDVSFSLPKGPITGLIGPNGAGKTTLFNCISGLHTPTSGEVLLHGQNIENEPMHEIAQRGIARTFQISRPFNDMTVRENLMVSNYTLPPDERARRIIEVLDQVELTHQAETLSKDLSGGQQTLLEIGRMLMRDPDVVLLDEPAAGVNPQLVDRITDLITRTSDQRTYIIVEHDITLVSRLCDRVLVLNNGALIADGPLNEIRDNEEVMKAYLGE